MANSAMENRTPILIKKSFSETVSTTPFLMNVSYALPSGYTIVSTYLVSNNAPWIAKGIEMQSNSTTAIYMRSLSGGDLSVLGTIIILALPSVNEMVGT